MRTIPSFRIWRQLFFFLLSFLLQIVYDNAMGPHDKWLACDDTVGEDYACDPQVQICTICRDAVRTA